MALASAVLGSDSSAQPDRTDPLPLIGLRLPPASLGILDLSQRPGLWLRKEAVTSTKEWKESAGPVQALVVTSGIFPAKGARAEQWLGTCRSSPGWKPRFSHLPVA